MSRVMSRSESANIVRFQPVGDHLIIDKMDNLKLSKLQAMTDDKYPSPDVTLVLSLFACILCFPIGIFSLIYSVIAHIERACAHDGELKFHQGYFVPAVKPVVTRSAKEAELAHSGLGRLAAGPEAAKEAAKETEVAGMELRGEHAIRMGRANRIACNLACLSFLFVLIYFVATGIFFFYYLFRTKCDQCLRQGWN